MSGLLSLRGLGVHFAGTPVLDGVSLDVGAGTVTGLMGPNGAGKTTLLDAVTGFAPCRGEVLLDGASLAGMSVHARVHRGIGRTFQGLELFEDLDVTENLRVVADSSGAQQRDGMTVDEVVDRLRLQGIGGRRPSTLAHDDRARVALARAVVTRPRLLLLDEPAAGLDDDGRLALSALLRELAASGVAVVLVDHDTELVLGTADVVHVLHAGRLLASGTPAQIRSNAAVLEAYLGVAARPQPALASPASGAPVLLAEDLHVSYGDVGVLHGVSMQASAGEVVAVLGRNGAGKSTLLKTFAGLQPVSGGTLHVLGATPRDAVRTSRRGVTLVPQNRGLFLRLTAGQNLRLARGRTPWDTVLPRFPELPGLLDRPVSELSGGQQQQLALARALLTGARLLLIDELSHGLAPKVVAELLALLRETVEQAGTAVVLVEQHAPLALSIADRAVVLARGRVTASGTSQDVAGDSELLHASYLGRRAEPLSARDGGGPTSAGS